MDPPGQVAQLDERLLGLAVRVLDELLGAGRVGVPLLPGPAEVHGQGHQPLLRPVVQVALDALALDLHRVDDAGAAVGERGDLLVELLGPPRAEQQPGQLTVERRHHADDEGHERQQQRGRGRTPAPAMAHPRSVTSGQM